MFTKMHRKHSSSKAEIELTKKKQDDENIKCNEESVLLNLKQTGVTRVGPHCQSQQKMTKSFVCNFCKQIITS